MAVSRLLRFGYARPHVFVAALPGGTAARLAVERYAREHGWQFAASPADTDLLAVCGETSAAWLTETVDALWEQVPAPRARVDVGTDIPAALEAARDSLLDRAAQHASADGHDGVGHDMHMAPMEHDAPEHGGHGGHHGRGGDVAGLPMADRGPDRDGLALDRVDVAIGPNLSGWPAGLRLRVGTQGDVAVEVAVELEPTDVTHDDPFTGSGAAVAAGRVDALAVLLDVCGADGWAARARRVRDELLAGADSSRELTKLARTLRRSRLLTAATDGVATLNGKDATARWNEWLDDATRALDGDPVPPLEAAVPIDALPEALTGLELGGLRIAVASLVPPSGPTRTPLGASS